MPEKLVLATFVSAPFDENTYVASLAGRRDCVVIDPGFEVEQVYAYLDEHGLTPAALLNTHGHADHIAGNEAMKARWPEVPLVIGRGDAIKLSDAVQNLSAPFGMPITSPPADVLLDDDSTYEVAGFTFSVHEIPGHSSGHVVFVSRDVQPTLVFGGDVLFNGSIGRTDFPDGDFPALAAGIHRHLFSLPDDAQVYPGHGPMTTVGREKRANPYVGLAARRR